MRYRKKPVTIEATRWWRNGDHPDDYRDTTNPDGSVWTAADQKATNAEGHVVRYFRHPGVDGDTCCRHCDLPMRRHGWIDTLEGGHIVCPGAWVITGVQGERYPCQDDIFRATYEEDNS